jgi:ceramide glucosyltransferase
MPAAIALFLLVWFGAEAALVRCAGWHWSLRMPLAFLLRDLLLPVLWIDAWLGSDFVWRGTAMSPNLPVGEETSQSPVV